MSMPTKSIEFAPEMLVSDRVRLMCTDFFNGERNNVQR
jgi:hypothetical protein